MTGGDGFVMHRCRRGMRSDIVHFVDESVEGPISAGDCPSWDGMVLDICSLSIESWRIA
jgi:hypothetical protein